MNAQEYEKAGETPACEIHPLLALSVIQILYFNSSLSKPQAYIPRSTAFHSEPPES